MDETYSVNEAAEKLGLERSHVRRLLAKGEIEGKKIGRDWLIFSLNYERKRKPRKIRRLRERESNEKNEIEFE